MSLVQKRIYVCPSVHTFEKVIEPTTTKEYRTLFLSFFFSLRFFSFLCYIDYFSIIIFTFFHFSFFSFPAFFISFEISRLSFNFVSCFGFSFYLCSSYTVVVFCPAMITFSIQKNYHSVFFLCRDFSRWRFLFQIVQSKKVLPSDQMRN